MSMNRWANGDHVCRKVTGGKTGQSGLKALAGFGKSRDSGLAVVFDDNVPESRLQAEASEGL